MDRREFMRALGGGALALVGGAVLWVGIKQALAPPVSAGLVEVDDPAATVGPGDAARPRSPRRERPPTTVPPTTAPGQPTRRRPGRRNRPPVAGGNTIGPADRPDDRGAHAAGGTPVPTNSAFANIKPVLVPEITPTDSFYITTKNFIDPTVDGNSWKLTFKGMVDNPFTLTLKDYRRCRWSTAIADAGLHQQHGGRRPDRQRAAGRASVRRPAQQAKPAGRRGGRGRARGRRLQR